MTSKSDKALLADLRRYLRWTKTWNVTQLRRMAEIRERATGKPRGHFHRDHLLNIIKDLTITIAFVNARIKAAKRERK